MSRCQKLTCFARCPPDGLEQRRIACHWRRLERQAIPRRLGRLIYRKRTAVEASLSIKAPHANSKEPQSVRG
jgi:hypothetical protein